MLLAMPHTSQTGVMDFMRILEKVYRFKYASNVTSYHSTGFSVHAIKKYKEKLLQSGLCFCIVEEVQPENGRHIRKLTFSSCYPQSEGLTFPGGLISN